MPAGQEEIDTAAGILFDRMKALGPNVPELIILPVYSALPSEMQVGAAVRGFMHCPTLWACAAFPILQLLPACMAPCLLLPKPDLHS